jgi:hypothetical protein
VSCLRVSHKAVQTVARADIIPKVTLFICLVHGLDRLKYFTFSSHIFILGNTARAFFCGRDRTQDLVLVCLAGLDHYIIYAIIAGITGTHHHAHL